MRDPVETVDSTTQVISSDPIYKKEQDLVSQMRTHLLMSNDGDPKSVKSAIQNVLVLRLYHNVTRITRFLDEMDKIEDKLYASIDASMANMEDTNPATWMSLLQIQERLQKTMVESQKLLEPYFNSKIDLGILDIPKDEVEEDSFTSKILDQNSREKIRTSAQQLLKALDEVNKENEVEMKAEETESSGNFAFQPSKIDNEDSEETEENND